MYTYTISGDFTNATQVDLGALQTNISMSSILTSIDHIDSTGDNIYIVFQSILSPEDETLLSTIVSNYTYNTPVTSTIYDAIVDSNGNGDYLLPSEAFNDGHISIYMRDGIYIETTNITMPNYGSIRGESIGNVIIYFAGTPSSVIANATNGVSESTGTITASNASNIITGTNTTFTNLSAGDYILICTNYFKILNITNNTSLLLEDAYEGKTVANISYIAQSMHTGIRLQNIIITGSTSHALYLRGCRHFSLMSVAVRTNVINAHIIDCGDSTGFQLLIENGGGFVLDNSVSIAMSTIDMYNNVGNGIDIVNGSNSITLNSCEISSNGMNGVYIDGSSGSVIINSCLNKANALSGILTEGSDVMITNISASGNTTGIHIQGDDCILTSNICNNNTNGIIIDADDCIVTTNICKGNTTGISVVGIDNIVSANHTKNNTTAITDTGTGTIVSNNKV